MRIGGLGYFFLPVQSCLKAAAGGWSPDGANLFLVIIFIGLPRMAGLTSCNMFYNEANTINLISNF